MLMIMYLLLILFYTVIRGINCYPTGAFEGLEKNITEKAYPNGTVVGKYNYLDKDGNPIELKYYANDNSYGIELKSVKVKDGLTASDTPAADVANVKAISDAINTALSPYKSKKKDPLAYLLQQSNNNNYKLDKPANDFETYYENDSKEYKKCGKDKVRLYFDKERRRAVRNAQKSDEIAKYCEQF